jgi:dienelactone hydrolase
MLRRMGSPLRLSRSIAALAVSAALLSACQGTSGNGHAASAATTTTVPRRAPHFGTVETHLPIALAQGPKASTLNVFVVIPVGPGPFPLVVFSHGYHSVAELYAGFLTRIASQGYVVAGPNFTSDDFTTHPAVITRVIDRLTTPGVLHGTSVDPHHIAVVGHSIGGLDALGVAYNSCCRDPRITAVLTFEAPLLDYPDGAYRWQGPALLVVLGTADPLISPLTGKAIVSHFKHGAYLLTIRGGQHGGGMDPGELGYDAVQATVHDFLAAYLYRDAGALQSFKTHQNRPGTTLAAR